MIISFQHKYTHEMLLNSELWFGILFCCFDCFSTQIRTTLFNQFWEDDKTQKSIIKLYFFFEVYPLRMFVHCWFICKIDDNFWLLSKKTVFVNRFFNLAVNEQRISQKSGKRWRICMSRTWPNRTETLCIR